MAIVCCSYFLTTNTKQIPDDTVNREEVLSLARRLELPHLLLSTPDCFVRHLSTIVRPTPRIVLEYPLRPTTPCYYPTCLLICCFPTTDTTQDQDNLFIINRLQTRPSSP